jgi:hypothetical protein
MHRPLSKAGPYIHALWSAIRADAIIYALVLVYVVCGYALLQSSGNVALGMLRTYAWAWSVEFGFFGPLVVLLVGTIRIAIRFDRRKNLAYRAMFAPARVARFVAGTLLLLTAVLLFTSVFSAIKTTLPLGRGFEFDVIHADLDKALHFGADPWRWLYAVAQHPMILRIVEANYNIIWFLICYFTLYWVVTSPRTKNIRVRYVLCWMFTWILIGNVMAGHWLSAGPAYYGLVTGDFTRFGEQLLFLQTTAGEPNSAHNFQSYLWRLYESRQLGIGSGISAFPSMHVAIATVNALFVGELSRRWGWIMWFYVLFIVLGSVYLAWHYAIDGYVSVATTTAVYWTLRKGVPLLARLRWKGFAGDWKTHPDQPPLKDLAAN